MASFIAAQRADHGIPYAVSCRALGVSEGWFYKWKDGDRSPRRTRRERLKAEVRRLFEAHKGKRGSPMITADLHDLGWRVSKNTVAALMAEMGLAARPKKKRKGTTRPGKGRWRAPDLVKRDFPAAAINVKWYGDGTDIDTDQGKLYLDSVLDVGSRRVLGFALGEHHDAELAYGALVMAVAVRGGAVPGVIMHTDQGSEYTAAYFRAACQRLSISQSMGTARVGAGQRGHRIVALDPGVRAAARRALRDQSGGPGRGRGLDRGLQPPPPALLAGPGLPGGLRAVAGGKGRRVTAARPLRGPEPEGGGFAAAHLHHRAAAFQAGGRAARGYGAAPPASSPSVTAGQPRTVTLPGTRTREDSLDPGDLCGPSGRKYGQAPACPRPGARRVRIPLPGHKRTPGNGMNWRSIVRRSGEITRIGYEEVSTV